MLIISSASDDDNGGNSGSVYIFGPDSQRQWIEQQKLLASDGAAFDHFGIGLAISSDTLLIGSPLDDEEGCPIPPSCNSGSVYVFRFDPASSMWSEQQKLVPNDIEPGDVFGARIALSGDFALIGSSLDDDNGPDSGSAYVFKYDGQTWVEYQKLLPANGVPDDQFGIGVAIDGDVAVVGARRHDAAGTDAGTVYEFRFNGTIWEERQQLFASVNSGSVYVFQYLEGRWVEQQELVPSDSAAGDEFSDAMAISGNVALIGSHNDDDNGSQSGSAYVFRFDGTQWVEVDKLVPADGQPNDFFGTDLAIDNDIAIVGASSTNDQGIQSGSAYLYLGVAGIDCNGNGTSDNCDILDGTSGDADGNGIPDECECPWDLDGNGSIDQPDVISVITQWGTNPGGAPDFDSDGMVAVPDLLALLARWGPCQ